MSLSGKSEINLEISSGFFRIATEEVIYNITVLQGPENKASQVVGRIVEEEKQSQPREMPAGGNESAAREPAAGPDIQEGAEDYYKQISTDVYNDIGKLAKSLSSTMTSLPMEDRRIKRAELDQAGEKIEEAKDQLKDIVSMTERATMEIMDQVEKVQDQTDEVKELLSLLKNHDAFEITDAGGGADASQSPVILDKVKDLEEKVGQAKEMTAELVAAGGAVSGEAAEEPAEAGPKEKRYLFALDVVFQTIYELCTNETVKEHIAGARARADEIFDTDTFIDRMSARVSDLEPDGDNFFTVPLSDVLPVLLESCSDKKIQNLLKKMDTNQGEIFLDNNLPLEVPPVEEVEAEESADSSNAAAPSGPDPRLGELDAVLDQSLALIAELAAATAEETPSVKACGMTRENQDEVFNKIENAFEAVAKISDDVTKITEALSFQDLSGQQILKIIKLLSDFQVQLLALVVSFGSQLKIKERDATISPEESKRLAQEEVDSYLKSLSGDAGEAEGPLDQETVNEMLERLGF